MAVAACAAAAPRLDTLSVERVWAELKRLLGAADPAPMIRLMATQRVLPHVLPGPRDVGWLERLMALENAAPPVPLRRLAALVGRLDAVEPVAQRLRLSRAESARLAAILGAVAIVEQPPCRLVRRFGRAAALDGVLLAEARGLASAAAATARAKIADWIEVPLPVTGDDVLSLGVPPGRLVGEVLGQIAAWWEDNDCAADRKACLAALRKLARKSKW
ncbi:MAG: hypothetical protein WDO24_00890 [Pseudomonadota bacterium]